MDFEVEKLNEGEKFELLKKINDHLGARGPNLQKMFGTEIVGTFSFFTGWVMDCFLLLATFYTMNFDKGQQKSRRIMGSKRRREKKTLDLYTFPIKGKKPRRSIRFLQLVKIKNVKANKKNCR